MKSECRKWARAVAAAGAVALVTSPVAAQQRGQGQEGRAQGGGAPGAQQQGSGQQQGRQQQGGQQRGAAATGPLLDVEELNDDVASRVGQRVSVAGEIEEWLAPRAFVLESGGIFDDEITVVVPQNAKGLEVNMLPEDADVIVTGTVRQATVVEVERELGWDFQPELEVELGDTRTYLVAERVTRQR